MAKLYGDEETITKRYLFRQLYLPDEGNTVLLKNQNPGRINDLDKGPGLPSVPAILTLVVIYLLTDGLKNLSIFVK